MLASLVQLLILLAVLGTLVLFSIHGPSTPSEPAVHGVLSLKTTASTSTARLPPSPAPPSPPPLPVVSATKPRNIKSVKELEPSELALLQFDSRYPLKDYWQSSALWNEYYCRKHGHVFIYYTLRDNADCIHDPSGERLASPWCKVKAMLRANTEYPNVQLFVYLDSDAVIDKRFHDQSLVALLGVMQEKLSWDLNERPVVFNQDGPCWWCKLVSSVGYSFCLNAGTVAWHRHPHSEKVLRDWWAAAMDEQLDGNPLRRRFRLKWPWEQDRQMAIYNRTPEHIQIASQPGKAFMDMRAGHHDWCLSHLPNSGCFISHHCENSGSKQRLTRIYDELRQADASSQASFKVDFL